MATRSLKYHLCLGCGRKNDDDDDDDDDDLPKEKHLKKKQRYGRYAVSEKLIIKYTTFQMCSKLLGSKKTYLPGMDQHLNANT